MICISVEAVGIENNRRFQVIFGRWRSGLDNELNILLYQRDGRHTSVQFSSVQFSRSVVSNSLQPHESQHARPPCPSVSFGFSQNAVPRVGSLLGLKCIISSVQFSHSVVSSSLRPHESQHARPPCPSPTPGVYSNSRPLSR